MGLSERRPPSRPDKIQHGTAGAVDGRRAAQLTIPATISGPCGPVLTGPACDVTVS
jgi:hypothetical protein